MQYEQLLDDVEQYVETFFKTHENEDLVYHNQAHTRYVVKAATQIANHYQLPEGEFFTVVTAAWFHDIGYYINPADHEQTGANIAAEFLQSKGLPKEATEAVVSCILSTKMFTTPKNLLEEIVMDADLFHLGTEDFNENNKLMRKESARRHHTEVDKAAWRKSTIQLFEKHQFHTDYARLLLTNQKMKNLEKLQAKDAVAVVAPVDHQPPLKTAALKTQEADDKEEKNNRPARGIETMFRISSSNHQRLSDMADSKAQIMITVNSIIISVLLSVLLRSLEEFPHLTIPVFLLVAVNVVTIVFSILSTRPTLPKGVFTRQDVSEKKVNLLFFGNFYNMNLEEYNYGMKEMMKDKDFLYGSLIKDGYSQGVVLGKKYTLLRISYNVFMYGLIISVLAFLIASIFFKQQ